MTKQVFTWYRRLSMINKITLWSSMCAFVSVVVLFFPQTSMSEGQTSYGSNSPNIQSSGDVNINYNSQESESTYSYIQHPNGGSTILISAPSLNNAKVLCHPESGSKVKFIQEYIENIAMVWLKVRVISGTCQGKIGWIGRDNYRVH